MCSVICDTPHPTGKIFTAHLHSRVEEVTLAKIARLVDKKTNEGGSKPGFPKRDRAAIVGLDVNEPVYVEPHEKCPHPGGFTLRTDGRTVAMGKVLKKSSKKYIS